MTVRKIVIAGTTSGVGKSTIATAIMYALKSKGFVVQPFKVGPDFIDPSYHTFVTGRQSRNLDIWMMRKDGVLQCFNSSCFDAHVAVIEGAMGLFDGVSGKNDFGSTAHVARLLNAPIILVIDAAKAARSIAATALGFIAFSKSLKIAGVILNNVAGEKHASFIRDAFALKIKIPIVGTIVRNKEISMGERHLGLIPTAELEDRKKKAIIDSAKYVSEQIDLDKIVPVLNERQSNDVHNIQFTAQLPTSKLNVAVALDESFNFYYAENLEALRKRQINLLFFSPVHDRTLPEGVSGIILGGGFPEVLSEKLSRNHSMHVSMLKAAENGTPIYAECGGLMYLTRSISECELRNNNKWKWNKMIGLIDADTFMSQKLTLNYTKANSHASFFSNSSNIRGHEFHYSSIGNIAADSKFAYTMAIGNGVDGVKDGFIVHNCLASYMHVHFADTRLPDQLVETFNKNRSR
ncbi:MAG: cobyrinate a,c-diamide synthase [Candidatus Nitrosopolaris sp.]|jgi:cobyrinic acid a,c-diamide synthase